MTMTHRARPAFHVARNGSEAFAVCGYWSGYWFTPGVPVAMS